MGFFNGGFDWNGNGKRDAFDRFMEMKVISDRKANRAPKHDGTENRERKSISMGGIPLYDAGKDSDGITILKCLLVVFFCLGGMALPVFAEMGTIGTLLCIFGGLGLGVLVLKNT